MQIFEDLNRIGNVDETPIWFDMTYNTTISRKKCKSTYFWPRKTKSFLNTIYFSWWGKTPLIIFKGTKNGPKENRLTDNIHVKTKEIFIRCQENSWASEYLFYEWLTKIGL